MSDEYYCPLTSRFLLGWRFDCDCDPAAFHRWNCSQTPLWAQTMRDLDCNPWTVMRLPFSERTFRALWYKAGRS